MGKGSESTDETQGRQLDYIQSIRALEAERDLLREQLELERQIGASGHAINYPMDDSA